MSFEEKCSSVNATRNETWWPVILHDDSDPDDFSRWDARYGAPPPSWRSVLLAVLAVALVLAVFADVWLPALDHSMGWLDAVQQIPGAK
ncbi:MAG: hypothetical protein AB7R67_18775 [Vicinamibacterales bacterium]